MVLFANGVVVAKVVVELLDVMAEEELNATELLVVVAVEEDEEVVLLDELEVTSSGVVELVAFMP